MVLFIFETKKAQKILLRISPEMFRTPKVDVKYFLRAVRSVPDKGSLHEVANYDDFRVFVWVFEKATPCSEVKKNDVEITKLEKIIEGEPKSGGKISYPYFTLKLGLEPHVNVTYPCDRLEHERVEAISTSLQQQGHIVHNIRKIQNHYCEFTGGGDIYIENVEGPLVFKSPDDDDDEAANLSPTKSGTQKLAQLSMEGKRGIVDVSAVIGQLWANMMLICVHRFVQSCDPELGKCFSKEDLISIQQLTGYGIFCSGDGTIGAYKLEIAFNGKNTMIEKIKPTTYSRIRAAKLMDYMLEYYTEKTKQTKP